MKTSITRISGASAMRTLGLALALACLVATAPLQAEEDHHDSHQQNQGHGAPPRQAYRHDDHHRDNHAYGDQNYAYGAPPVVYAPQESPGISLFLPL